MSRRTPRQPTRSGARKKIGLAIADTDVSGCDSVSVTVSVAVGQLTGQEWSDALVVRVVTALARAKRAGRKCVDSALY